MVVANLLAVLLRTTKLKKFKLFQEDIPEDLLEYYRVAGLLAVDTELTGLNLFRDKIATIQLSDGYKHTLVQISRQGWIPENLKALLENKSVEKVFHFALLDVCFLQKDLNIETRNFQCTKVMSKIVRTYTQWHGLRDLAEELLDIKLDKKTRETCWFGEELSKDQINYAIGDVVWLLDIYRKLNELIESRGLLGSGRSCQDINQAAQSAMTHLVPLIVSGYGDKDPWDLGWLFKY